MAGFLDDLRNIEDGDLEGKTPPSPKVVAFLLGNGSTTEDADVLHTIGNGQGQVARGLHTHNGKDSPFLFDGVTLNDLPASPTSAQIQAAVNAINALMRAKGAG